MTIPQHDTCTPDEFWSDGESVTFPRPEPTTEDRLADFQRQLHDSTPTAEEGATALTQATRRAFGLDVSKQEDQR